MLRSAVLPGWGQHYNGRPFKALFFGAASGAAEIIDHRVVTRMVARASRREFFLVEPSKGSRSHTVLPGFCTCPFYAQRVAGRTEELVCKHELAALIAVSIGRDRLVELDENEWAQKFSLAITLPMSGYGAVVGDSPAG